MDSQHVAFVEAILQHPYLVASIVFAAICVITRIKTGRQFHVRATVDTSVPRAVPMIPYWVPWIGHTIPFAIGFQDFFKKIDKRTPSGIFALRVAGGTHNIVMSPSLAKKITGHGLPLRLDDFVYYIMKTYFGDKGLLKEVTATPEGWEGIWVGAHKTLAGMLREAFLAPATDLTARAAGDQVWNLVSGNSSWVDQSVWERAADIDIKSNTRSNTMVAEANLYLLLRNWVSNIASPLVMGQSFMDNNPNIVNDIWLADSKFNLFLTGLPHWLIPGLSAAYAARERVVAAVCERDQALIDVMEGKDPGTRYDNLSDVPQYMWDRTRCLRDAGCSIRCTGASNYSVLWAMNINANQLIFWMIYYIYSDPALLTAIRAEISPFVRVRTPEHTGLPILESPKQDIDVKGLTYKSPLLKGAFHETMRLEMASTSFRKITADFTVTESEEDAKLAGKQHAETYTLKKGDLVCVPGHAHQLSPHYFKDPEKFDAKRFWVTSIDEKTGESKITVDYKTMLVWGGGDNMCKGRNFAEREVLIFVASIVSRWEMEPVNGKTIDGTWKYPGQKIIAGTALPKKDIRVKMWRRTST